jgi:multiple sugar transport system ATP-binding protein
MRHVPKQERATRVRRAARVLGLGDHLERRPSQLSGGQRQRVAMGRAIVREPKAFLMDEPLSNLDARLRAQMRTEIVRIQRDLQVTTLYVTHDQVEAMTMADRVAVMRDGVLQQFDTPNRVYDEPGNLFVASFVGSPPMNLAEATLETTSDGLVCRIGNQTLKLPETGLAKRRSLAEAAGRPLAFGVRPEAVSLTPSEGTLGLKGRVLLSESLGSEKLIHVEIGAKPIDRPDIPELFAELDESTIAGDHKEPSGSTTIFIARVPPATSVDDGEPVTLALQPSAIHFFDLRDGQALR